MQMLELYSAIDRLRDTQDAPDQTLLALLRCEEPGVLEYLYRSGRRLGQQRYGAKVYIRGLIELTNYCKNDCLYCGIRRSNTHAVRYRLSEEDVLACCDNGYGLGFRTFVLQGGEDPYYNDERVCSILKKIKTAHPDCAVTLSIGEKSRESYQAFFDAGADRYLLRHETVDEIHYQKLHPADLSWKNRIRCLVDLKEIGYQVGCGFMVGSPYQTIELLVRELRFLQAFRPHMVGIGPFIPQKDTPFGQEQPGTAAMTIKLLAIIRLLLPDVLLPATTALGTIQQGGREAGILAGANVVMPNLSPEETRKKYALYDNKLATGAESAQGLNLLRRQMDAIGYQVVTDRGDSKMPGTLIR